MLQPRRVLYVSATVLVLAACQAQDTSEPQPAEDDVVSEPSQSLVAMPPRDVAILGDADLSFHRVGGAYEAGHLTHAVRLTASGDIRVEPRHWDRASLSQKIGAPFELRTTDIYRGDVRIDDEIGSTALVGDRTFEIARGFVREHIENRDDGIEQSWLFGAEPPADGELVVHVAVSGGQQYTKSTKGGLHFEGASGPGIAYSHALWRDATGTEWDVPVSFANGQIEIRVGEQILAATQYPAVLDPTVSVEYMTDSPALGSGGAESYNAQIASNGTGYLVVWQERRDSRFDDIYAARVSSGGVVQDTRGIKVSAAAGTQSTPTVAWTGSAWLVAWADTKDPPSNSDIVAATISTAGVVTQLGTVAGTAADETAPALAGNGTGALLTWQSGTDVMAAAFTGSFGAPFAVAATAASETEPTVAANPAGNYLVAFTQAGDIRGQLVTPTGAVSGASFNIAAVAGAQTQPAADFDGTNFVVVYNNAANISGTRVSATGTLVDAMPISINAAADTQDFPSVSCTSTGCFAIWRDRRANATTGFDVYGARLGTTLVPTVNDIAVSAADDTQNMPAIARAGTQWLAVWAATGGGPQNVVESRISDAGAVLDTTPVVVSTNWSRRLESTLAAASNAFGLFYDDSRLPFFDILGNRFNYAGSQLDTTPKVISSAAGSERAPAAAKIGSSFAVVWQDSRTATATNRDVFLARVNPATGDALDTHAISTAGAAQLVPAIAGTPTGGLVVWQDSRGGNADIYAAVVDASGNVTTNDIQVCATAGDQVRPAVAYDSQNSVFLVVWSDPNGANGPADIRGARVSAAGAVLDANCGVVISGAANAQFSPAVAYGYQQFLVAWEDRRSDATGDIFGTRVTTSGSISVLDANGIAISTATGAQGGPAITTQSPSTLGTLPMQYVIAWTDGRDQATTGTDIWGTRMNAVSGALEPAFAISQNAGDESEPALAEADSGTTPRLILASYTRTRTDLGTTRIQVRRLSFAASNGGPCNTANQCGSGFCVDSVCCDTACNGDSRSDCFACSTAHGAATNGTCGIIVVPAKYLCRPSVDANCDRNEFCDGTSSVCPPDQGIRQGQSCTLSGGGTGTCPSNAPPGPHVCI